MLIIKGKKSIVLNIVLAVLFVAVLIFVTIRFGPYFTKIASKPQEFRELLNSFGWRGVLVFMLIQVMQVVVVAIPGEFVQIAGGFLYGSLMGTVYSLTGIVAGSVIVFYISRLLGYPIVKAFVSEKSMEKFNFLIKSNRSEVIMFLLFLIPGIPKDALTYVAGLTPIKPLRFFAIITIGRFPALFASSIIGSSAQKGNYPLMVGLSIAAIVLFGVGIVFRERIIEFTHKLRKRE